MDDEKIFTTYETAKIFKVDISTVIHWIDGGKLNAYRTPGGHRRVRQTDLIKFAEKHSFPIDKSAEILKHAKSENFKVLIVDDDPDVMKFMAKSVKTIFKRPLVAEAPDGLEAGRLLAEMRPDIMILDLRLPGINGFEVLARLRKSAMFILAVTAFPTEEIRKRALEAGADDFLAKPFTFDDLKTKLRGPAEARKTK